MDRAGVSYSDLEESVGCDQCRDSVRQSSMSTVQGSTARNYTNFLRRMIEAHCVNLSEFRRSSAVGGCRHISLSNIMRYLMPKIWM
jgi:hypothetical protein